MLYIEQMFAESNRVLVKSNKMSFKNNVKRFGREALLNLGFEQKTPWVFEKQLKGFSHGIGFVQGTGGRKGLFTVDIYWRYTNSSRNTPWAMDCHRRIGSFLAGNQWYEIDKEDSYEQVSKAILLLVQPFLKEHETIESVLASFETHRYSVQMLFGSDVGWRNFNIGFCYLWIGNKEKASKYLQIVVEQCSKENFDWVQERKSIAIDALKQISRDLQSSKESILESSA